MAIRSNPIRYNQEKVREFFIWAMVLMLVVLLFMVLASTKTIKRQEVTGMNAAEARQKAELINPQDGIKYVEKLISNAADAGRFSIIILDKELALFKTNNRRGKIKTYFKDLGYDVIRYTGKQFLGGSLETIGLEIKW